MPADPDWNQATYAAAHPLGSCTHPPRPPPPPHLPPFGKRELKLEGMFLPFPHKAALHSGERLHQLRQVRGHCHLRSAVDRAHTAHGGRAAGGSIAPPPRPSSASAEQRGAVVPHLHFHHPRGLARLLGWCAGGPRMRGFGGWGRCRLERGRGQWWLLDRWGRRRRLLYHRGRRRRRRRRRILQARTAEQVA